MNSKNTGVSVIIPCYNAGNYLKDSVNSLREHLKSSIHEIIISDDGSNDNGETDNVLDFFYGVNGIKILKHTKNNGAQYVRNKGLEASSLPYVFMFDADDVIDNSLNILSNGSYAQRSMDILSSNNNIGFVHASTRMFGNFNGYTISPYKLDKKLVLNKHHVPTYMFYRKEDALRYGIYDESIKKWQDWSAGIGLLNSRFKEGLKNEISFLNTPYYLYREHSSTNRISGSPVDEKEMIYKTITLYPEIFQNYYNDLGIDEIVNKVFISKPSRLIDLLYVSNLNSIDLAKKIVLERGWYIEGNSIDINILLKIAKEDLEYSIKLVNENGLNLISEYELGNIP